MAADPSNDPVTAFASTCERYIALCLDDPRPEFQRLWSMRATLGELVAGIERLPVAKAPTDLADGPPYDVIRRRIGPRFPSVGYYNEVMNPLAVGEDMSVGVGDVIDDLVDIHQDLLGGLQLFREGRHRAAAGHWLRWFEAHWGAHAVGALGAIHAHLVSGPWRSS